LAVFLEIIAHKGLWKARGALAMLLCSKTSLGDQWIVVCKSDIQSAVSLGLAYSC